MAREFSEQMMNEVLDLVCQTVEETLRTNPTKSIRYFAMVVMRNVEASLNDPNAQFELTIVNNTLQISEMAEFAQYVGANVAQLAPERLMEAAWLIGEAWTVETEEPIPSKVSPSQHPDRKEIIFVSGASTDGAKKNFATILVDRNHDETMVVRENGIDKIYVGEDQGSFTKNTNALLSAYMNAVTRRMDSKKNGNG